MTAGYQLWKEETWKTELWKSKSKQLIRVVVLVCFLGKQSNKQTKKSGRLNFFLFFFFLPLFWYPPTRVVDELPEHNKLLLQHIVCVLHHILKSADTNKMGAHNLAVCIGPTLLQVDDTPLDEQKEKMQKVESLAMNILSHFWCFEALRFIVQKTSKGFITKVRLAQMPVCLVKC